jgi:hypothetical protein
MYRIFEMENGESGDELGSSFLHSDHAGFLVQDEMEGDYDCDFECNLSFTIEIY